MPTKINWPESVPILTAKDFASQKHICHWLEQTFAPSDGVNYLQYHTADHALQFSSYYILGRQYWDYLSRKQEAIVWNYAMRELLEYTEIFYVED